MNWLLSLCPRCFRRSTVAELTSDYLKEIDREIFSRELAIIRLQGEVAVFRKQREYLLSRSRNEYESLSDSAKRYYELAPFPPVA